MPRISEFFGITVFMYHNEHGVAHFHAHHAGRWLAAAIETGEVLAGALAPASQRMLMQWAEYTGKSCATTGNSRANARRCVPSNRYNDDMKSPYEFEPAVGLVVLRPYVLRVLFADGLVREIDLEPELRGSVFEPLKDPEFFSQAKLDLGVVAWPNGADFAPEFMYRAGAVLAEPQPA